MLILIVLDLRSFSEQRAKEITHQIFVDVYCVVKDCPHNCFCAIGGGQGARVAIEFCEVYVSNEVINREDFVYRCHSACGKVRKTKQIKVFAKRLSTTTPLSKCWY